MILGAVFSDNNVTAIFYKKGDSLNRQRFTIAHELAHCCLNAQHLQSGHIEFRNDIQSSDPNEIACNTFARELLIPEEAVIELNNTLLFNDVASLSKIFGVSKNVMKKRLEGLNLI